MKAYTLTLILIFLLALICNGNNDLSKFNEKKTKQIDSLSVVYNSEIIKAQKVFEKSLLDADKKYTDAMKKIEDEELKLLEKLKVKEDKIK